MYMYVGVIPFYLSAIASLLCYTQTLPTYGRWTPAFPKPIPQNMQAMCMAERASWSSALNTALQEANKSGGGEMKNMMNSG